MLNQMTIMGRLVETPELRETSNKTPVTSFRIACSRDYIKDGERDTDFVDIDAWRQVAEFVCKHFEKGQLIVITGRLKNKQWTDKHDQKRTDTVIEAERAYFGEGKKKSDSAKEGGSLPDRDIDPFAEGGEPQASEAPSAAGESPFPPSPWDQ